jgi:hypothetical protein
LLKDSIKGNQNTSPTKQRRDWRHTKKQRDFLDQLAYSMQFNPLDTEKWYSVTLKDVIEAVMFSSSRAPLQLILDLLRAFWYLTNVDREVLLSFGTIINHILKR